MSYDDFNKFDDCKCKKGDCVCKTVRKIAEAQDAVRGVGDCDTGCKQSIHDLLSPATANGFDTVPFILYCRGTCHPFIAQSVIQATVGNNRVFQCLETPIFRVSRVKKDCCAELELLLPVTQGGSTPGPGGDDVCDYFPGNSIRNLQRTGVCITVDLCEFMAIACLDPVRTLPVNNFDPTRVAGAADARKHD